MKRYLSSILALLLVLSTAIPAGARTMPPASEEPAPDPSKVRAAIERVKGAPREERRRAVHDLIALGPGALAEARKARDEAADPEIREALARAARWLLAARLKPILLERWETNLTFDGQYDDLKSVGSEAGEALLALFDDEETPSAIRIAAARALADFRDAGHLPRLRRIESDPLLPFRLKDEAGTLLAILGDTREVDQRIQEYSRKAEQKVPKLEGEIEDPTEAIRLNLEKYQANVELSNLYYRIRQYKNAVACYERAVEILEAIRAKFRALRRPAAQFDRELALNYYNFACSLSLNKEIDRAKEMIRKSVQIDITHLKNIDKDGDLRNLREAPGYAEFKRELEKPLEKKSI